MRLNSQSFEVWPIFFLMNLFSAFKEAFSSQVKYKEALRLLFYAYLCIDI